jgi:hypothetical protein
MRALTCHVVRLGSLADVGLCYLTFIQSKSAKNLHGKGLKTSITYEKINIKLHKCTHAHCTDADTVFPSDGYILLIITPC